MGKKFKRKHKRMLMAGLVLIIIVIAIAFLISLFFGDKSLDKKEEKTLMENLSSYSKEEITSYANDNGLELEIIEVYDFDIESGKFMSQNIEEGTILKKGDKLEITISKGSIPKEIYVNQSVNELGNIPVMMYHGISNIPSNNTAYTGGNVDKDGYNRTSEAFREDLEMYYKLGYRMIRLIDYVNGNITTELGKSPIVLTFDDGRSNNLLVTGLDESGNIIIDPNSAVGILEEFKKKYPDFGVTATFFLNSALFEQEEYNEKIMNWLVNNGYDIGNHTKDHVDFTKANENTSMLNVSYMYKEFDKIIPEKYVNIVALPFGSPYSTTHKNFKHVISGEYEGYTYDTVSTLRVGWEPDYSPFHKSFIKTFIKRVRAYDNKGVDFDIDMVFNKLLPNNRYISDGDSKTIVYPSDKSSNLVIGTALRTISY